MGFEKQGLWLGEQALGHVVAPAVARRCLRQPAQCLRLPAAVVGPTPVQGVGGGPRLQYQLYQLVGLYQLYQPGSGHYSHCRQQLTCLSA